MDWQRGSCRWAFVPSNLHQREQAQRWNVEIIEMRDLVEYNLTRDVNGVAAKLAKEPIAKLIASS